MLHWQGPRSYIKEVTKLIAYLGRYGKQPAWWCWQQTMSDLGELSEAINEIVSEENGRGNDPDDGQFM